MRTMKDFEVLHQTKLSFTGGLNGPIHNIWVKIADKGLTGSRPIKMAQTQTEFTKNNDILK